MKKTLLKAAVFAMLIFSSQKVISQVGIGTTLPHSSSILEIQSASAGLLIPRVSLTSTTDNFTIPSPATSLLVYNISTVSNVTPGFYYWDGFWKQLMVSGVAGIDDWKLVGNTLTTGNEYLGTNNYFPLVLKANSLEIAKFHPNGGINMGIGSMANINQSVAIGDFSDATGGVKAFALGAFSNASGTSSFAIGENSMSSFTNSFALGTGSTASGANSFAIGANSTSSSTQSLAIGTNSSASSNYTTALGYNTNANNTYATALGFSNTASGLFSTVVGSSSSALNICSTAIGYRAIASQNYAIVLGEAANAAVKVGIGTSTPDEKLHVVGSLKLVDGTQGFNKVLVSDANGKARWDDLNSQKIFGEIFKTNSTALEHNNPINFNNLGVGQNVDNSYTAIKNQTKVGVFKITYSITIQKNSGSTIVPYFYLTKNGTEIAGSRTYITIGNNETRTVSLTKYATVGSWEQISVRSSISDSDTNVIGGNLILEFVN